MRRSIALVSLLSLCAAAAACGSSGDSGPDGTSSGGTSSGGASSGGTSSGGTSSGGASSGGTSSGGTSSSSGDPGKTVTTVRVHYAGKPGALTIRGSGASLDWNTDVPMKPEGADTFSWSSDAVTGTLEIKPLLAGAWSKGPNYKVAAGKTIDVYPRFATDVGTYTKKWPSFTSTALPSTRGVWVYLPPTYLENTAASFPVLYMHDAQNLFSSALAFGGNEWKVDETLDAGAGDGSIREVIVVGVENTPARVDELTPSVDPDVGSGGKLAQYLAMLTTEIKPMVDKELRTLPGRDTTGIMGSSLGGLASAHAGVMNADVFGIVGEMSPSTWWDNRMILGEVATTPGKPQKPARVYVDCGDNNDGLEDTQLLEARYETAGYTKGKDLMYVVQPGAAHNEIYWSQRLPAALRFLFGRRPDLN